MRRRARARSPIAAPLATQPELEGFAALIAVLVLLHGAEAVRVAVRERHAEHVREERAARARLEQQVEQIAATVERIRRALWAPITERLEAPL